MMAENVNYVKFCHSVYCLLTKYLKAEYVR